MPNSPRRHFLPWDRPLLPQAVAWLAGGWRGPGPLDLSGTLVIVPTRQSGRRLREALADYAAERGSAVFPPRVLTPEALILPPEDAGFATRLQSLLAWADVFRTLDLDGFREVFPIDPPARDFPWALRLAEQFTRLQGTLNENALRFADVPPKAGADFSEAGRWQQLATLEQRYVERLATAGLKSPYALPQDAPHWREGVSRVVLLATVDPLPSVVSALAAHAESLDVDIVVFAPPEEAGSFDPWGRPAAAAWAERQLAVADFEQRVHLCADPSDEAQRVAHLATGYAAAGQRGGATRPPLDGLLAIGIADPDVVPALEAEAARSEVRVFNPEGRAHRGGALYHLLVALRGLLPSPTFEAVEALARCPDFLSYLGTSLGRDFSAARFLADLDRLRQRHLPADLASARAHAGPALGAALTGMAEIHADLANAPFPENIAGVLGRIFAARRLDPAREPDGRLQESATAWTRVLRECATAAALFPGLEPTEAWDLALRWFGDSRQSGEKPSGALDLQGWLELLFEDAPHLVVAGMNDGLVPDAIVGDAFLPESLRVRLGLKTNAGRFARDAYLLQAIRLARGAHGRLDLLLAKNSSGGDPLRPSRLLLRCPDDELPRRVAFLFRAVDPSGSHLPWTRAWRLRPGPATPPDKVAVTALRRWLACPFRFYLKTVLRMEALDPAKSEMDAFDFGTLCHAALEAMGHDPAMRDCTDAAVLREFLLRELARHAEERYGRDLTLPLLIQVESARQRLGKLAELQARERAEGWVIQAVEVAETIEISGLKVHAKIDRIDRNVNTGAVRVVDYKTSDTGVNPRAAHLRALRAGEEPRPWACVTIDGKPRVWTDLQLPLYRHALAAKWGGAIACGYINLPKAVGQTALALWDDLTPELHESAMRCAEGVCAAIRAGEFWPPNEDIRADADEFAPLFHEGVAASVDWPAADDPDATDPR